MVKPLNKPIVQFVGCESGDWIGCYVDGVLIDEGHSLYAPHLLKTLSVYLGFTLADTIDYTDEQMDQLGNSFPERQEWIDDQLK